MFQSLVFHSFATGREFKVLAENSKFTISLLCQRQRIQSSAFHCSASRQRIQSSVFHCSASRQRIQSFVFHYSASRQKIQSL